MRGTIIIKDIESGVFNIPPIDSKDIIIDFDGKLYGLVEKEIELSDCLDVEIDTKKAELFTLLMKVAKRLNGDWVPMDGVTKYFIERDDTRIVCASYWNPYFINVPFKSLDLAQKAVKILKDAGHDLSILFK